MSRSAALHLRLLSLSCHTRTSTTCFPATLQSSTVASSSSCDCESLHMSVCTRSCIVFVCVCVYMYVLHTFWAASSRVRLPLVCIRLYHRHCHRIKDGDALFGARSAVAYQSDNNEKHVENNDVNTSRMDAEPRGAAQIQFGSVNVVGDLRKQQKDAWLGNPKDPFKGDRYTYKESLAERRQRDHRRVLRQESWLTTY